MKKTIKEHCCQEMSTHLNDSEICLYYSDNERFYGIDYKPRRGGGVQIINFCPWCGKKLPKPLIDEYTHIVFDELKLDPSDKRFKRKLPAEFKTDEWWKKRGL